MQQNSNKQNEEMAQVQVRPQYHIRLNASNSARFNKYLAAQIEKNNGRVTNDRIFNELMDIGFTEKGY